MWQRHPTIPVCMTKGCYWSQKFMIHCNASGSKPPTPKGTMPITSIVLETSELHLLEDITQACYNETDGNMSMNTKLQFPPLFTISHTKNSFYGVGCGSRAAFVDLRFVVPAHWTRFLFIGL